ncbi:YdcF family protein [Elongatibacter sediminis]|uniref:YdcF family protein n=1 Tax=Elongatibacter sediminis TaxID=3119006 RepID=A0AAW9RH84_9GAMM
MYVYLSKIVPLFLMPLGLIIFAAVLVLLLLVTGRRRLAAWLLSFTVLLLWLAAMPIVAGSLYGRLESRFPPEPLARIPVSSCIVVLGGAVGLPFAPRQDIELTEAVDRVYKAVQLYREGKANRVFVAAGNQPRSESGPSEAALIGELLVEWGVPADAIQLEGRSRNTRENAVNIKPMLEATGCDRSLLVTSAAHMQRALASFKEVGLYAYPVSTDVRAIRRTEYTAMDFLPDAHALAMTSDAIREWMGQKVYQWNGWN